MKVKLMFDYALVSDEEDYEFCGPYIFKKDGVYDVVYQFEHEEYGLGDNTAYVIINEHGESMTITKEVCTVVDEESTMKSKREKVLEAIKPICEVFSIDDYDYWLDEEKHIERLIVQGTEIGCSCNSISAIIDELIGYIFVMRWTRNRSLGAFQTQVLKVIKRYWINEGGNND